MRIPKKILETLSFLGIKIVWKPKIYERNIYILSSGETSKVLRSTKLPLVRDEEIIQGYVREDLEEIEVSSLFPLEKFRSILKEMREYLPSEYYSVLVQACNVIKFEELGKDRIANRVLYFLRSRWGSLGAKIYNLLKTSFFITEIYPRFQSIVNKHAQNKDTARGEFIVFLDKTLEYFKYAVWVTRKDRWQTIKERIKARRKSVQTVAVFARGGDSIEILDKAINSLIEEDASVNTKLEALTEIRGIKAKNVVVGDPELIESLKKKMI